MEREDDDSSWLSIKFDISQVTILNKSPVAGFAWDSTLKAEDLKYIIIIIECGLVRYEFYYCYSNKHNVWYSKHLAFKDMIENLMLKTC